jgi:hypothetical protein
MRLRQWRDLSVLVSVMLTFSLTRVSVAQDSSGSGSWTSSSQQAAVGGRVNPTRTTQTHSEVNGRAVDKTSVETLGPDGRYIPYSQTEKESVRVNDTTVRSVERTYGTGPDGQRILIQERQEETRTLPGGEQKVLRTISNPDANGGMQVIQREESDSKQVSPGVRDTTATVFSADGSGGLSATVHIEEHEKQSGGATEFKKSTLLSDSSGHWNVSEIREGTAKADGSKGVTREENVLRPDLNGKLSLVERTVTTETKASGENRETTETYSTNVPGQAGDEGLQLVKRESAIQRTSANGTQSTVRQIERPNPGDPKAGLHVTQEAIDIVRPGGSGVVQQQNTISTADPDGRLGVVSIDMGKSDKPATVQVDTSAGTKPK